MADIEGKRPASMGDMVIDELVLREFYTRFDQLMEFCEQQKVPIPFLEARMRDYLGFVHALRTTNASVNLMRRMGVQTLMLPSDKKILTRQ